jgi:hypothetical protein
MGDLLKIFKEIKVKPKEPSLEVLSNLIKQQFPNLNVNFYSEQLGITVRKTNKIDSHNTTYILLGEHGFIVDSPHCQGDGFNVGDIIKHLRKIYEN